MGGFVTRWKINAYSGAICHVECILKRIDATMSLPLNPAAFGCRISHCGMLKIKNPTSHVGVVLGGVGWGGGGVLNTLFVLVCELARLPCHV